MRVAPVPLGSWAVEVECKLQCEPEVSFSTSYSLTLSLPDPRVIELLGVLKNGRIIIFGCDAILQGSPPFPVKAFLPFASKALCVRSTYP